MMPPLFHGRRSRVYRNSRVSLAMMNELKRPPLVEEGAGGDDAEIDPLPEFDGGRRECFLMVLTVRQMCGLAWTAAQGHTNF